MICIFEITVLVAVVMAGVAAQRALYYKADSHNRSPSYINTPKVSYNSGDPRIQDDVPEPFHPSPHGFQFSSFRGPVSGAIEEITVPYVQPQGAHSNPQYAQGAMTSFDYVAKPDYAFTYGLQDPESGNAQTRQEARDGDTVHGEYKVMEPDGTLRTVTYSADPVNGFKASVKYGPSGLPPPPPPTPTPTSGYTGVQEGRYNQQQKQHRFKVNKRLPHRNYDEDEDF